MAIKDTEMQDFLDVLAETGSVIGAARQTKIPRKALYHRRRLDEEFRNAWDVAVEIGLGTLPKSLNDDLIDRARNGPWERVYATVDVDKTNKDLVKRFPFGKRVVCIGEKRGKHETALFIMVVKRYLPDYQEKQGTTTEQVLRAMARLLAAKSAAQGIEMTEDEAFRTLTEIIPITDSARIS